MMYGALESPAPSRPRIKTKLLNKNAVILNLSKDQPQKAFSSSSMSN